MIQIARSSFATVRSKRFAGLGASHISTACPRAGWVGISALFLACSSVGCSSGNAGAGAPSNGAASNASAGSSSASGGTAPSGGTPSTGGATGVGGDAVFGASGAGGAPSNGIAGASSLGGSTSAAGGADGGASGVSGGVSGTGAAGSAGSSNAPSVPGVRIVGRTVTTATGTRFEWSGSSVVARFTGTQVSAQLSDGNNANAFEIVVDGGTPKKIFTVSGQTVYPLASGLTNGPHDLLLWRDTEANVGPTEFQGLTGFSAGGALLPPPAAPAHRIEIVGDSFSCGAGVEGNPPNCGNASKIENHYMSYGAIAARAIGADLVTIAWSGIGVYRNFGATKPTPTTVMPARYDYAIPTDTSTTWDFSKYQPDAVIMNLNNNDFSTGDPGQPYVDAYTALYKHIRDKYPSAYIFQIIQWNSADPTVTDAVTTINAIVASLKAGGDTKTEVFDIRKYSNTKECGGHPDAPAAAAMGAALAAEVKTVLGW